MMLLRTKQKCLSWYWLKKDVKSNNLLLKYYYNGFIIKFETYSNSLYYSRSTYNLLGENYFYE